MNIYETFNWLFLQRQPSFVKNRAAGRENFGRQMITVGDSGRCLVTSGLLQSNLRRADDSLLFTDHQSEICDSTIVSTRTLSNVSYTSMICAAAVQLVYSWPRAHVRCGTEPPAPYGARAAAPVG